ncbi:MAG: HisA/HisF-related TIM barrel protein [Methylovulum sp.]|uniref:HisA/HisF-related TIM barrel protein n=1 Tax=Methylovulum sp. TaxID=1916980 RepID=UPI0026351CCC|nr:HisA/HisF-related TIM barrel protein [Methylovulum sp.]MDD2725570.1 HisA/HisF-related TIM barrel protein [Methylovulum sp.]MDD5126430.1 HisA/HisF-related TIM barrel protein [Methylovulum sp.]
MKIIPVLDLKNNQVVHARQGEREHYQPICSQLCRSADIFEVIPAFLSLADFDTFYIADLNAITQQGGHDGLLAKVLAAFPEITFWVDRGYQRTDLTPGPDNYLPVLGSESYDGPSLHELAAFQKRFVLSLDYSASGQPLGAAGLFTEADYWPENIIIMTLAQVGRGKGPDLARLAQFCSAYPDFNFNFIAAGGVRNLADLQALSNLGVRQAMVASALHSGAIGRKDLANLVVLQSE